MGEGELFIAPPASAKFLAGAGFGGQARLPEVIFLRFWTFEAVDFTPIFSFWADSGLAFNGV